MPAVMTYDSLVADLKAYLDRGEVTDVTVYDQIPRLIMNGEFRLAKESKTLLSLKALTSTLTVGSSIVSKPAYWRNTDSVVIGTGTGFNITKPLFLRPYQYCRMYWSDTTQRGEPKFYADYDFEHWFVVPTPDQAYPIEVISQDKDTPLDSSHQTNFFTNYAPDILLHACLLEADIFLKNFEQVPVRESYFDRLLKGLTFEDEERKTDKSESEKEGA